MLFAAAALLLFSCTPVEIVNPEGNTPGGNNPTPGPTIVDNPVTSVTIGAEHISAASAVLKGKAIVKTDPESVVYGFQYYKLTGSTSAMAMTIISTNKDETSEYSVALTGLEPDTSYKYWSFVRQNGRDTFGETGEFTTTGIETLIETKDATEISATSATLNASADLADVGLAYKDISYGFLWGESESVQDTEIKCENIEENAYTATLEDLSHKTHYWYKAYVTLDDRTLFGEVKTFTTDVIPVGSISLDETEYTFNEIGKTLALNATILPADATDKSLTWTTSDDKVATVTESGEVKAMANGSATITATAKDGSGVSASCTITVKQRVTVIYRDKTSLSLEEGQSATIVATVTPENAYDKSLTWTSSNESVATVDQSGNVTAKSKGTATIKAKANDGSGINAECPVRVCRIDTPEAIDLGLSVKWASFNVGAGAPEEYGLYYAWGETSPKSNFTSSNLKYSADISGDHFSKYVPSGKSSYWAGSGSPDNKTVLDAEDDVAHVKFGGKWRMPTDGEWTELMTKCTWTWKTNYNGSGINGRLVTGPNGNSIFLPAAGQRGDTFMNHAESYAYYWSSSLRTDYPFSAWGVYFDSGSVRRYGDERGPGSSVRPVVSK